LNERSGIEKWQLTDEPIIGFLKQVGTWVAVMKIKCCRSIVRARRLWRLSDDGRK